MTVLRRFYATSLWRIGGALWLFACALAVLNWFRQGLAPENMNPAQGHRVAALWLTVMLATAIWAGRRASWVPWAAALVLSAVTLYPLSLWPLALVTGSVCLWATLTHGRPGWLLTVPCAFVASMTGAYERLFGRMSAVSASTIFQTDSFESVNYLLHLVTPGLLVNWALFSGSLWLFAIRLQAAAVVRAATWPLAVVSILSLLLCAPDLLERAMSLKQGWLLYRAQQRVTLPAAALSPRKAAQPGIDIVWVIGESSSRWHWQLYGYPRATTPHLSARATTLVVLRDAVAPHSYTVQSVMESAYRPVASGPLAQTDSTTSIVDVLQSASVPVHWFSAQERFGPWSTPITSLAERADTAQFFGSHLRLRGSEPREDHPDNKTQAALLRVLSQPATGSRVLVHHMFAAHDPYCTHRPVGAAPPDPWYGVQPHGIFGSADDRSRELGCYENAIRFTDELLDAYAGAADKRTRPTVLLFVPDHGEAPEDGSGHNADRPSARHVEIPALLYFNPAARKQLPAQNSALLSHTDAPFLGSWTFELLLDLLEIPADDLVLRTHSPASINYRPPQRTLYPDGRRWNYDDPAFNSMEDVLSRTRHTLQRARGQNPPAVPIYAHRVNTLLKAQEAARYFDGVELDVVFDAAIDDFFVFHPPMRNADLRLAQQLQALKDKPDLRLWFDFKNPSSAIIVASLKRLEALDPVWKLRRRTIVEIPEDRDLSVFAGYARAGWSVSLNIGDDFSACNSRPVEDRDCRARAVALTVKSHSTSLHALSFDYALWPAVSRFVHPLKGNLRYYSWRLDLKSSDPDLPQRLAEMPRFEGLIVTFPSQFNP